MRYGNFPDDSLDYIKITVRLMTGKDHILFTDDDDETFFDVKMTLLPHLHKPFDISQLVFQYKNSDEDDYEDDYEDETVSSSSSSSFSRRVITLELILKEWTCEEQAIFDMTSTQKSVFIFPRIFDTLAPGKLDAVIRGLEINDCIKSLHLIGVNTMPIMRVFREKTKTLEELKLSHNGMNADEMSELFDIIAGNTAICSLTINNESGTDFCNFRRNTYRMNDLSNLLSRNTSLLHVSISDVDIEIDEDLSDLAYVLQNHRFVLRRNRITSDVNRTELIDSLQSINIKLNELNILDNEIKVFSYGME
jgi:hypothetical protein